MTTSRNEPFLFNTPISTTQIGKDGVNYEKLSIKSNDEYSNFFDNNYNTFNSGIIIDRKMIRFVWDSKNNAGQYNFRTVSGFRMYFKTGEYIEDSPVLKIYKNRGDLLPPSINDTFQVIFSNILENNKYYFIDYVFDKLETLVTDLSVVFYNFNSSLLYEIEFFGTSKLIYITNNKNTNNTTLPIIPYTKENFNVNEFIFIPESSNDKLFIYEYGSNNVIYTLENYQTPIGITLLYQYSLFGGPYGSIKVNPFIRIVSTDSSPILFLKAGNIYMPVSKNITKRRDLIDYLVSYEIQPINKEFVNVYESNNIIHNIGYISANVKSNILIKFSFINNNWDITSKINPIIYARDSIGNTYNFTNDTELNYYKLEIIPITSDIIVIYENGNDNIIGSFYGSIGLKTNVKIPFEYNSNISIIVSPHFYIKYKSEMIPLALQSGKTEEELNEFIYDLIPSEDKIYIYENGTNKLIYSINIIPSINNTIKFYYQYINNNWNIYYKISPEFYLTTENGSLDTTGKSSEIITLSPATDGSIFSYTYKFNKNDIKIKDRILIYLNGYGLFHTTDYISNSIDSHIVIKYAYINNNWIITSTVYPFLYLKDKNNVIISTIPVPFLNRYPEQNKFESNTETFIINTFTESNEISVYENGDILLYKTPIILKGIETKLIIEYKYTNNWNIKARFSPPFYLKSNLDKIININFLNVNNSYVSKTIPTQLSNEELNINNSEVIVNITPDFDNINVYDIVTNRLLRTINVDKNVTITLNINYTESDNIVTIEDVIINKISSTLYLKSENGNLNDFVNELNRMKFLDNYEGEVGVNIIPSQSTRLMVYETLTNKFIHITDCLIKSVYITINFKYKFINGKWIISSNIETLNPLPVPDFNIYKNQPKESFWNGRDSDSVGLGWNGGTKCDNNTILKRYGDGTQYGSNSEYMNASCLNIYSGEGQPVSSINVPYLPYPNNTSLNYRQINYYNNYDGDFQKCIDGNSKGKLADIKFWGYKDCDGICPAGPARTYSTYRNEGVRTEKCVYPSIK